ncbi:peptidase [Salmonella enterica subsp. enterica]
MGDVKSSTSGTTQKTEQCVNVQDGKITNDFKKMMEEALRAQMAVLNKRKENVENWGVAQSNEFIEIFGIPDYKEIKLEFPYGVRNNHIKFKVMVTARDYIKTAVLRLHSICKELSADGECVNVNVNDHRLQRDANGNAIYDAKGNAVYVDSIVIRPRTGNYVNFTDNDSYTANVPPSQIDGVRPGGYGRVVAVVIGKKFIDMKLNGKNSKVSTLCHELSHYIRYGNSFELGGMWTEDMPVDRELDTSDKYSDYADELKNNKNPVLFQNAYNIERYFEI